MAHRINIEGERFGRLLAKSPNTDLKIRRWNCVCDCGSVTTVSTNKLTSGHTSSCGCWKVETTLVNGRKNKTHGASHLHGNSTYRSWGAMRYRCKPNSLKGLHYSDRGIKICARWDKYENFLADMGERPEGTSLDRIDVDGDYEPNNCRWATPKVQQRNKQKARRLVVDGVAVPIMDVADEIHISKNAMQNFYSVAKKLKEKYGFLPDIEDRKPMDS